MKYDFTTVLDRYGKDAIAAEEIPIPNAQVEEGFTRLPMWVADMSFPTAPAVLEAIKKRLENPTFGYFNMRDEYYEGILRWHRERNGMTALTRDMLGYENGVLGGVGSALRAVLPVGGKVLLHTPAYVGFTGTLNRLGYEAVHSPLIRDENGVWRMDFGDMEKKIAENRITAAVFCSPHNPCGRVWERWELESAMAIFEKYGVTVLSDEIWSDLILPGHRHIPTYSVSDYAREHTASFYAPSKTFSLAGLVGAYHVIPGQELRAKADAVSSYTGYNECNVLSMHALIGAYSAEGGEWVDELCEVLAGNTGLLWQYLHDEVPEVRVFRPEGTYMLFLDCGGWVRSHSVSMDELLARGIRCGVIWQDGRPFFHDDAIRVNTALPRSQVEEAVRRLRKHVFTD